MSNKPDANDQCMVKETISRMSMSKEKPFLRRNYSSPSFNDSVNSVNDEFQTYQLPNGEFSDNMNDLYFPFRKGNESLMTENSNYPISEQDTQHNHISDFPSRRMQLDGMNHSNNDTYSTTIPFSKDSSVFDAVGQQSSVPIHINPAYTNSHQNSYSLNETYLSYDFFDNHRGASSSAVSKDGLASPRPTKDVDADDTTWYFTSSPSFQPLKDNDRSQTKNTHEETSPIVSSPEDDADAAFKPSSLPSTSISASSNAFYKPAAPDNERPLDPHITPYLRLQLLTTGADDNDIRKNALTQVDYLSYDWKETDIWASWREITKTKANYDNGIRLENASWRTWMKHKFKLKTISPETLNWLKECDVTWLYGPLLHTSMPSRHHSHRKKEKEKEKSKAPRVTPLTHKTNDDEANHSETSSGSSLAKKPILKRRTPQELLLSGRDLTPWPQIRRFDSLLARNRGDIFSNRNHATIRSALFSQRYPSHSKRHIHFNDRVQQCIAVDIDSLPSDSESASYNTDDANSVVSPSKDGISTTTVSSDATRSSQSSHFRIIEDLPDSKLKYSLEDQATYDQSSRYPGRHFGKTGRSHFPRAPEYYGENDFEEDEVYRDDRHYENEHDEYDPNLIYYDNEPTEENRLVFEDTNNTFIDTDSDDSNADESQFLEYANDSPNSSESLESLNNQSYSSSPYSVFSHPPPYMGRQSLNDSPQTSDFKASNLNDSSSNVHSIFQTRETTSPSVQNKTPTKYHRELKSSKDGHEQASPLVSSSPSGSFTSQISPAATTTATNLDAVSLSPSTVRTGSQISDIGNDAISTTRKTVRAFLENANPYSTNNDGNPSNNTSDVEVNETSMNDNSEEPISSNWLVDLFQKSLKSFRE